VGHREHRALERLESLLEGLGRLDVEVVGGLVEQQQRRPGQLEHQDLEAGLLAAAEALELLLGGVCQLVAVQHPGGLLAAHTVAMLVAPVQDLQQRAADQLGVLVGLDEPARADPRAELRLAGVVDRLDLTLADRLVLYVGIAAAGGEQP
jgi:hypothetical protein